ncbi:MAG TPA: hypothetical protein VKB05_14980 [Pyrinomonadaceae bacterium]|nr:hypothetical protein [Pyrinomonadaceae bacterium]
MTPHSSATERETPHATETTTTTITNAVKRRAQSVINDRSIEAQSRNLVRYALQINDPWLAELVRRVDAGETIDTIDFSQTPATSFEDDSIEQKIEALTEMICRAADEPETKSAALLVLMAMLENAADPKLLANTAKHLAFTHCGEFNLCGMVDAQIPVLEADLLADTLVT